MSKEKYSVTLRKERLSRLPKKILLHQDIQIREGYTGRATIWVADRPENNLMPTVNLTLSHGNDSIRLCFQNAVDLSLFADKLFEFVNDRLLVVHDAQAKAIREWHEHHKGDQLPHLNDTTDNTVLQGRLRTEHGLVDTGTGEIVDERETEFREGKREDDDPENDRKG